MTLKTLTMLKNNVTIGKQYGTNPDLKKCFYQKSKNLKQQFKE